MVFNATFNNVSVMLYRSVFWWRKPEYPETTTDLLSFLDDSVCPLQKYANYEIISS